jgi:UDP-N-acetylglucosamine--N-acetylmuramyl-(pentapeptide) pyrophosphoryl-undecaprenol N-acetylglucosamine transferase
VKKKYNILLATGGTGGHIFPALALKEKLEEYGCSVKIAADSKFAKYHKFDEDHIFIPSSSFFSKDPIKLAGIFFTLAKGFIKALWHIYRYNPDVVMGFGGYATYPTMLAAIVFKKEIILHEANTVIGKVNRLLLCKAKYLTTGFKKIQGVKSKYSNKIVYTGNPVRADILSSSLAKKKKDSLLSILVIGGSQGAKVFSKMIPKMVINLPQTIKDKLYISQQVREEDIPLLKEKYAKEGIKCEIASFFDDMAEKLTKADFVIARSGASTIAELIVMRVPAILIPYPTAADNHQYYNAKELEDAKASWLVKETLNSHVDILRIVKLINKDPAMLKEYSKTLKNMNQDASENIAKLFLS